MLLLLLEITAVSVSLTAAFLMTLGRNNTVWISLLLWTLASVLWGTVGYLTNNWALVIVNIGFFIFESIGVYKWISKGKHND